METKEVFCFFKNDHILSVHASLSKLVFIINSKKSQYKLVSHVELSNATRYLDSGYHFRIWTLADGYYAIIKSKLML